MSLPVYRSRPPYAPLARYSPLQGRGVDSGRLLLGVVEVAPLVLGVCLGAVDVLSLIHI